MKKNLLTALSLLAVSGLYASEPLTLSFQRTGTDLSAVNVTANIDGVTASLTSLSHAIKNVTNTVICADVNGSGDPTIVYNFTISGLPDGWSFNNVGLDVHALNGSGGDQQSNDNKVRQFNVSVTSGSQLLTSYTDLDPAAGITGVRKVWDSPTATEVTPGNPFELVITVTKGTRNDGCFFGLEGITLSTTETEEPEPPVVTPTTSKFYTIKWKNNTQNYMTEQADGSIAVGDYQTYNSVFWEFIPTDNENCYYIRNTASGKYIGSCNMTPNSASRVHMSDTPVEYYVHLSAATSGDNKDCYWMSSTDCDKYNQESEGARCLNKDGASSYVITWTTSTSSVGSYWTLIETENLYEPRPFTPGINYFIMNSVGETLTYEMTWQKYSRRSSNGQWKFIGDNTFQIVNAKTNEAINNGTTYKVETNDGYSSFKFVDSEGNGLILGGQEWYSFVRARENYALNHQIYRIPCGSIGDTWISQVTIGDDFRYPMATQSLMEPTVTVKPQKYIILSSDAATVAPGTDTQMTIATNKALAQDYTMTMYVDWNRDGVFEYSQEITDLQNITLSAPDDAVLGRTRLRLRLNNNGHNDAEDDISGQAIDLLLKVAEPSTTLIDPTVKVNDLTRGTATWENDTASATKLGNAMFLYWGEGNRISSLDSEHQVAASNHPRTLTAVFTVNTEKLPQSALDLLNKVNTNAVIEANNGEVSVIGADAIVLMVFNLSGQCISAVEANTLNVSELPGGIYIAKAVTADGVVSAKIRL
ncbi:MAG: GEVED domain-containing protein [Bacteroides sp.]|nr:GEVED domain-containing protein [Bacteroides sp.]MCM1379933.1 GEVED domain-containing protein [Bacteroides sp.]MCM1446212.1 GEVED domain-containing protein [Prevotella sp.]